MYTQKIQSCHQDFQIRKVTCGLRSKTIVTHRNFRTPEDPSVTSGISRRLCAISGSSSRSRRSLRAWTPGSFGNGVSRRAKVEARLEKGRVTVVGRPSARAAEREGGPSLSSSGIGRRAASVSRPSARDLTAIGRARARAVPGSAHEA
mgnify:CR=1 FL=1